MRPWQPSAATIAAGPSVTIWRFTLLLAVLALTGVIVIALASLPTPMATLQRGSLPLPAHVVGGSRLSRPPGDGLGSLASAASASIGASERNFWAVRHGSSLVTEGGGIHSAFSASGVRVSVAGATLGLRLSSVGRGKRLERPKSATPSKLAGEVVYTHGSVTEFYRNGPYGLEQGFTLRSQQTGAGALLLAMGVSGSLIPEQAGAQILFRTPAGITALRYGQLRAVDATGRQLPTSMRIRSGTLQLRIDDRGARYPLQIDPFFQQGPKLTSGEESGKGLAGESVSLSADGDTAVVGAPNDNSGAGAAWVFTRSGVTWAQQGPKLLGGEASGKGHFGNDVAVSGDGSTVIIGGPGDNSNAGAAWIFTRSGSIWEQQAPKLTGGEESGAGRFGFRVALSGDGTIATIGGPGDNGGVGAAWSFTRSGSIWEQQAPKLVGGEEVGKGEFGVSVALSSDASTALIGGGGDNNELGAAWVFARSGSTWEQQGPKLTGGGEVGKGHVGYSVALSADGSTALVGGLADASEVGAAWVFTRSGSSWEQQGSKLTGGGEIGKALFGYGAALSADGTTALVGGGGDSGEIGAAWAFLSSSGAPPTVTAVSPSSGSASGGSKVTIKGSGFVAGATVTIGSAATAVTVVSATEITATTAATAAGSDEVIVTDANGTSSGGPSYTYIAPPPPKVTSVTPSSGAASGGTSVTIKGSGFVAGATVTIGSAATAVTVVSATEIEATTAASAAGSDEVVVTDANGTSSSGPSYTYIAAPPPTVTSVTPASGPAAGGTSVAIEGSGFLLGATVAIGGEASEVFVFSETELTATTPASLAGSDEVVVTDANGTSAGGPLFTYEL